MTDRVFAEHLRARIEADPKLTEAGLAVKAGLSNSVIRKLLAGNTKNPRLDTAKKICAALGTTYEEFMSTPQTLEEHQILHLVSQLPAHLRRQLLGYGQALLDASDHPPSEPVEGDK
jgi:transcriptional regulator with XRE-family HTH domain